MLINVVHIKINKNHVVLVVGFSRKINQTAEIKLIKSKSKSGNSSSPSYQVEVITNST